MSDTEPQNPSRRRLLIAAKDTVGMFALERFAPPTTEKKPLTDLNNLLNSLLINREHRSDYLIRNRGLEKAHGFGTYYGHLHEGQHLVDTQALETPLVASRLETMVYRSYPADQLKKIIEQITKDPEIYNRLPFKFKILYDLLQPVKDFESAQKVVNNLLDNSVTPDPNPDNFNLRSLKGFCATLSIEDIGIPYFAWKALSPQGPIAPVGWILPIDAAANQDWRKLANTTSNAGGFSQLPWVADLSFSCFRNFPPKAIPPKESAAYYTTHASSGIILLKIDQLKPFFPSKLLDQQPI